jgi:hypothetical protein
MILTKISDSRYEADRVTNNQLWGAFYMGLH